MANLSENWKRKERNQNEGRPRSFPANNCGGEEACQCKHCVAHSRCCETVSLWNFWGGWIITKKHSEHQQLNLESRHIATTPRSWCRCKYNCLKSENCQWREHHGAARKQAMIKLWWGHLNASHCNVPSEDQHEGKTKKENIHLRNRNVANYGHKIWGFLPVSFVLKPWKEYPFFQIWLGKGVFMFDQLSHLLLISDFCFRDLPKVFSRK